MSEHPYGKAFLQLARQVAGPTDGKPWVVMETSFSVSHRFSMESQIVFRAATEEEARKWMDIKEAEE